MMSGIRVSTRRVARSIPRAGWLLLLGCLTAVGPAFAATVGYWRFEKGQADTVASGADSVLDASGLADHGTPSGSPVYRSDVGVPSIPFTGAPNLRSMEFGDDQKVSLASMFRFHAGGDATLEFWIQVTTAGHRSAFCVPTLADGTPCDDGASCTSDDQCVLGMCAGLPACALVGSWQQTIDCGGPIVESAQLQILNEPGVGLVTSGSETCSPLYLDGAVHEVASCTGGPRSVSTVNGIFRSPAAGFASGTNTFATPFPSPTFGCINPPAAAYTIETRVMGTIMGDGQGHATAVSGALHIGQGTVVGPSGAQCNVIVGNDSAACTIAMRRNEVPVGPDVAVQPLPNASVQFATVETSGTVLVSTFLEPTATVPANFQIADLPIFYDVSTTAAVSGPILVCLPYPDANDDGFVDGTNPGIDETQLLLLHEENGTFVNRTTTRDTVANQICAETTHLSQFVFGTSTVSCGNATVDQGEACDFGAGLNGGSSCCSATCEIRPAGTACREVDDYCDVADTCDGTTPLCVDGHEPEGIACPDDGNPCTLDACNFSGRCAHSPGPAGGPCIDDANPCTLDVCGTDGALCTERGRGRVRGRREFLHRRRMRWREPLRAPRRERRDLVQRRRQLHQRRSMQRGQLRQRPTAGVRRVPVVSAVGRLRRCARPGVQGADCPPQGDARTQRRRS